MSIYLGALNKTLWLVFTGPKAPCFRVRLVVRCGSLWNYLRAAVLVQTCGSRSALSLAVAVKQVHRKEQVQGSRKWDCPLIVFQPTATSVWGFYAIAWLLKVSQCISAFQALVQSQFKGFWYYKATWETRGTWKVLRTDCECKASNRRSQKQKPMTKSRLCFDGGLLGSFHKGLLSREQCPSSIFAKAASCFVSGCCSCAVQPIAKSFRRC